jgi:hypothetical protein
MSTRRIQARRDFQWWERRFDAERKEPAARIAWSKLLEHGCDPHAIKSALYYTTQYLRLADEARRGYELDTIRAEMLTQVGQMKEKLRQLTSIETLGECFAERILLVRGRKKSEIRFVQSFPALLLRLENILNDLKLPPAKRDTFKDWLISNGEALFHLYVKEVTRKAFPEEAAVLLEAAAGEFVCERTLRKL